MTIYGSIVDPAYSRLLMQQHDLPLSDIIALDRVQKRLPLSDESIRQLKKVGLIEGRKPMLHISAMVANVTAKKADYIRMRAQDDDYYAKLITDYLGKFDKASRQEIDKLLLTKISDALDDKQKRRKVGNLLTNLRRAGRICNTGSRKDPEWKLAEKNLPLAEKDAE